MIKIAETSYADSDATVVIDNHHRGLLLDRPQPSWRRSN
jgi:hypothetical protein